MEVRGYVIGAKRTKVDEYRIGFSDIATLVISLMILALIIVVKTI
jgi:energy-coupling factor transport system permease protein